MTDELPKDLSVGLFKLKFQALGTQCSIIFKTEAMEAAEAYRQAALAWVKAFEAKYSRFREDSLISTINQKAGDGDWIDLDEDAETILGNDRYRSLPLPRSARSHLPATDLSLETSR